MTEGLWEGEDGGPGWGVGIALGGSLFIASPERRSCWKGAEWGQALPKKKSRAGSWEQAGEGPGAGWPAWRRFRSLGSEAVLGSWLEPLISKQRVTWMPGIPEPGLFRCALPPPPTLLPAPRPPRFGGRTVGQRDWDLLSQWHLASPREGLLLPPLLPSPWPPSVFPESAPTASWRRPHPPPRVLSWWLGMAKVSSLSSTRAFKVKVLAAQSLNDYLQSHRL